MLLDASVAVAWIAPSQATAGTALLLEDADQFEFVVPFLFPLDLRNGLLRLERKGALPPQTTDKGLAQLEDLGILIAAEPEQEPAESVFRMARKQRLSLIDAFYVELTLRIGCSLASRDGAQLAAAGRMGAPVVDLRGPAA